MVRIWSALRSWPLSAVPFLLQCELAAAVIDVTEARADATAVCEHAATLQVWTRRKCYTLLQQSTHRGMRFLLAAVSSIRLCTHFAVQDALSSAQSEVDRARDESDVARREADAAREHAMALHEAAEAQRDHVTRCAANRCPVTHSRVRATAALLGLLWIEHDRTDARLLWLRAMVCITCVTCACMHILGTRYADWRRSWPRPAPRLGRRTRCGGKCASPVATQAHCR